MTSNPVKEEAVTPEMIKAGHKIVQERGGYTIGNLADIYLAMRQADPRIAELKAALEELTAAVDAYNANHSHYPTQRVNNAAKRARAVLNRKEG